MLQYGWHPDAGPRAGPHPVQRLLFCFGAAALTTWSLCTGAAAAYQWYQGLILDVALEHEPCAGEPALPLPDPPRGALEAPDPRQIETGRPLGRIEFPRLGASAIVVEGADEFTLGLAVGHVPGTALPGEIGNIVLAGHRDTFFRPLQWIRDGDEIMLVTTQGLFSYRVEWTAVVSPERTELLAPTSRPALTLVTCYPFRWIGAAPQRFIVRAEPRTAPDVRAQGARPRLGIR